MESSKVDSAVFRKNASAALESVFTFAEFVKQTENIFDCYENSEFVRCYKDAWFELEVVNAVALEEWEADGRPSDWTEKWKNKYRKDASEVVDKLVKLLEGKR